MLTVHPSVPAHSTAELIALAKARPGGLTYGSSGIGRRPDSMEFTSVAAAISLIKASKLRPIAVTSKERVPAIADVPALAESRRWCRWCTPRR